MMHGGYMMAPPIGMMLPQMGMMAPQMGMMLPQQMGMMYPASMYQPHPSMMMYGGGFPMAPAGPQVLSCLTSSTPSVG
jgi:hypothetical protein